MGVIYIYDIYVSVCVFIFSFIHFRYLYSAPSRFLLRGAPDYSADTESEFHAEAHEQLRVKDLPRVPTRRLEVDSNPQPSEPTTLSLSLYIYIYIERERESSPASPEAAMGVVLANSF